MFERIYEDNISGKLSDKRFAKMSQRYREEQAALSEKIKALRKELDKLSGDSVSTDMFLATVRKYTRAKKLTPRMLNELVNHIEVHQAEKINGEWVQKLTIYYNCVGALFIPDTPSMPVPDVTVNTRRGVYVSYEPAQNGQQNDECSQRIKSYKNTRHGTPEGTRTPNPRNRNPMLYPLSHWRISSVAYVLYQPFSFL